MTRNWINNKELLVDIIGELTDGQKYHIQQALELGYDSVTIANKLGLTLGKVEAMRRCIDMGWHED